MSNELKSKMKRCVILIPGKDSQFEICGAIISVDPDRPQCTRTTLLGDIDVSECVILGDDAIPKRVLKWAREILPENI